MFLMEAAIKILITYWYYYYYYMHNYTNLM